ncbi:uroporphyrinogen-III synthase [Marivibrio halodurans]|uniref:Uroporphyrinogen-III synthase n=1 Tax=Marivibrio halodurans TaxID=2039722 RepID=A0A8J7V440_9PROT|nr:uroporphyrinogen-III synthase [Marivibrio halodurans]MBP5858687.1 uroporphyrinogen-III synthase [Marivibrio halodurans]
MASSTDRAPTVLVTRPAEDAGDLIALLEAAGFGVMPEPLLTIRPLTPEAGALAEDLADVQALLFTSANGARAFARLHKARDLPTYCVGPATAAAARLAGFSRVETATGDVAALSALVTERLDPSDGGLFHAAGSDLAGDLAGRLGAAGFGVTKRALYRAEVASALDAPARAAIAAGEIEAVVLFSPRTADTFRQLVTEAGLVEAMGGMTAACLSPAVADRLSGLTFSHVVLADRPEAADMVSALRAATGVRVREDETPTDSAAKADKIEGGEDAAGGGPDANGSNEGAMMNDDRKAEDTETSDRETAGETESEKDIGEAAPAPGTPGADAVIEAFGGIRPMATRLKVAVSTVQGWKARNHIPESRWRDIIAAASAAGVDLAKLTEGAGRHAGHEVAEDDAALGDETGPWADPVEAEPVGDAPETDGDETAGEEADGDETHEEEASDDAAHDDETAGETDETPSDAETDAKTAAPKAADRHGKFPENKGGTGAGGLAGAFAALIALVAILAVLTEPYWRTSVDAMLDPVLGRYLPEEAPRVDPARIEDLANRVQSLGGRVEDLAARTSEAIEAASNQTGGNAAGSVDNEVIDALRARLDALESLPLGAEGGMTPGAMLDAVTETTGALEDRIDNLSAELDKAAGTEALTALRDRVAALESRIEQVGTRVEEVAEAPALKGAQQAATVIAVGSVQDALAAGRPFDAPLERVRQLAPADGAFADAVARLAPHAAAGVATRAALLRRFEAEASAMHDASASDGGWVDQAVDRLTGLVSVRQTGEAADRPPVSRAEAALARGDLAGAVAALSEIREASPRAAAWLDAAEARLDAEAAGTALREAAIARLSAQTSVGQTGGAQSGDTQSGDTQTGDTQTGDTGRANQAGQEGG